jgi:hypothetical protein
LGNTRFIHLNRNKNEFIQNIMDELKSRYESKKDTVALESLRAIKSELLLT